MTCWCEHELLERKEAPLDFLEALPRHIKAVGLGESTRRALEKGPVLKGGQASSTIGDVFATLAKDGVKSDDKIAVLEVLAAVEKAALLWTRAGKASDVHKAVRAREMIAAVRSSMPGLGQTPLETSKLASNRDVGLAVLEALSRVLESRVALMAQMIEEVLEVGTASRKGNEPSDNATVRCEDPAGVFPDKSYIDWHTEVVRQVAMLH